MPFSTQNIQLQSRDLELMAGLFDSRLMTLEHAAALHFNGSREAAKKRIQKLKAAGLIGERSRKAYEPSILFLTRAGFTLLNDRELLQHLPKFAWTNLEKRLQVSELTLRHELEVMDVKAAICSAIRTTTNYTVADFTTWPAISQFEACPGVGADVTVKPDGFIRIQEENTDGPFEHVFYLEIDRSTETLETLSRRALCYLNFYQRGGLAERFGRPISEYKDFPFRVLMIFKTAERRNNLAERLLAGQRPILTQVWLSTLDEVKADPLGPIWIQPKDYREAIAGTDYANPAVQKYNYVRDVCRENLVASSTVKHALFALERQPPQLIVV